MRFATTCALLSFLLFALAPAPITSAGEKNQATEVESKSSPAAKSGKESKNREKKSRGKQAITPVDYAQWERLSGASLSHDGAWLVYTISRVDGNRTLHLQRTKAGKKKPATVTFQQGERPVFSDDSQWLSVTIGKSPAELKKAKKDDNKEPAPSGKKMKLRHLESGETTEFENVKDIQFSADSRFIAIEVVAKGPAKPSGPPKPGPAARPSSGPPKALVVRDLAKKTDITFGNVAKHAWSDRDSLLAMVIDSPGISNALQVFDPGTGILRVLESSDEEYSNLAWRDDSTDLAAMREMKHEEKEDVSHVLLAWHDLGKGENEKLLFDHSNNKGFPKSMFVGAGGLSWSEDGKAIFCDLREWEKKPKSMEESSASKKESEKASGKDGKNKKKKKGSSPSPEKKDEAAGKQEEEPDKEQPAESKLAKETPADGKDKKEEQKKSLRDTIEADSNVEIWHSKDVQIMPKQKKTADEKKNPKRRAVWWPKKGSFVQLANELTEDVRILRSASHAVGTDRTPHERDGMFGSRVRDIYLIDTRSGKRDLVLKEIKYLMAPSPDGRFLLYLKDGQVWSHEVKSGKQRNLTGKLEAKFTNEEDDTLAVEKRPYGDGEWLLDGSAVLLYDTYDIWMVKPDGSGATKLTNGAKDLVRHRLSRASYHQDDDGFLDPQKPFFLALYGDRNKKSGYARLDLSETGRKKRGKLEELLWEDRRLLFLQRARDAEVYTFTRERFDDSPDLFLSTTEADLSEARKVTNTNAFQKNYQWGHSELVDFENERGVKLQGSLTYPANYKPGRKYPMIVYIYEKRSQDLHRYITPSEKHPYNPAVYSAEGYFVFQPDIVYRPQEPGISALECVVPAVKEVLRTGMIDGKRVGLVGHSWGAYQTAFIVTRSDLFAAGVAGAPLTDMMSMSVSVYWNSGETNAAIFTQSQGRMDKPFWRDVDNYVRNSPIHGLDNLKTPLLITFGDKDGAVDFGQGVQMYNAARWAGKKDLVMLVYPGENHSLKKEENAVDYHYRVLEWFAHYLDGEKAPAWITEGKSFLDRQKELKEKEEKKEAAKKKPAPKPEEQKAPPESESKKGASPAKTDGKPVAKDNAKDKDKADSKTEPATKGRRKKGQRKRQRANDRNG